LYGGALYFASVALWRRAEARIAESLTSRIATDHDSVTGLLNGAGFEAVAEQELNARKQGHLLAVIGIDMRGFKRLVAGGSPRLTDALLAEIATRLRSSIRHTDTAARIGGDHFAVLVRELNSVGDCHALCMRIVRAIAQPAKFDGEDIDLSAAIGVAFAPSDGTSVADLLRASDIALQRAKSDTNRSIHFFRRGMDVEMADRRKLESDLRHAIARDELVLYYQPQVSLDGDRIAGYEALVRWQHPERGLVPPDRFIQLAEESDLILRIGRWVLTRACEDAAGWPKPYRVAVNLSGRQLRSRDIVQDVQNALKLSGLSPRSLELEVTETALLTETKTAMATLRELKALGVTLAMDDFGTGYSSLSHLLKSPFDTMKVDRSFVNGIGTEGDATAIVRAVLRLGQSLNLRTVAEGVETPEQLAFLRSEGCDEIQGYLIAKPRPLDEILLLKPARAAALSDHRPQTPALLN
ncbi:MAG: bifunctional diguanylate cyclase/phosphodiesterase, partial [Pseudomonadota bacterium]